MGQTGRRAGVRARRLRVPLGVRRALRPRARVGAQRPSRLELLAPRSRASRSTRARTRTRARAHPRRDSDPPRGTRPRGAAAPVALRPGVPADAVAAAAALVVDVDGGA